MANEKPIIIKKVYEEGGGGHHGGAWKVAYADFVTAMMAFFLLLWILNSTTEEQKTGLSDYFAPSTSEQGGPGGDGIQSGMTVGPPGTMTSSNSPMNTVATPLFGQQDPMGATSAGIAEGTTEHDGDPAKAEAAELAQDLSEAVRKKDEQSFKDLEEQIVQAMNEHPDLEPLVPNIIFEKTEEGLMIQIVDQDGKSMFDSGSAKIGDRTNKLMSLLGRSISQLPNDIVISGHTDAVPFADEGGTEGYGNWELSSDRANATRRVFLDADVSSNRFVRVSGLADTTPLVEEDPLDPRNRRISVVLKYMQGPSLEDAMAIQTALENGNFPQPKQEESTSAPYDAEIKSDTPKSRKRPNSISIHDLKSGVTGP